MTTTNSLMVACDSSGVAGSFGTAFTAFGDASQAVAETAAATKALTAFTLVKLGLRVISNASGSTRTYVSRNNGVNGNNAISVLAAATGWFSDSTHSDSITAGNTFDISRSDQSVSVSIFIGVVQHTGPVIPQIKAAGVNFSNSTNYQWPFGTMQGAMGTESQAQAVIRAAGTWQGLTIHINSGSSGAVTIKSRKNTADGNQILSIASGTGTTQDSTHTDSIASGDLLDISNISTAVSGQFDLLYSEFACTISAHDTGSFSTSVAGGTALSASTADYWGLSGPLRANTTEVNVQTNLPYALTLSRMRGYINTNVAATLTITSRKNTADGNSTISVGSGVTGEVEDSTHSDSYVATDLCNFKGLSGTVTVLTMRSVRALLDDGSVSSAVAYTLTAAEGTYALTGKAILFSTGRRVTAAQGTYTLTGETALFPLARKVTAVQGVYVLTGKAAGTGRGLTLTAVEGTYTLTGKATLFSTGRRVTAAQGSYVLTGKDVHRGFTLVSDFGSYHLIGQDVLGGRRIILTAKHGRYHVRKQKTILRYNNTSVVIWPVDSGEYVLDGQDLIFGEEVLRLTFSEFSNSTFLDWEQSDYTSYLDAAYVLPDGLNFTFIPYVYVFIEEGQTSDDVSLLMTVAKDWAETGNLPKLGGEIQVYRYRNGYLLSVSKNRVRGKGRAFQLQFVSETGKDFNLRGWGMWLEKNTRP